MPRLSHFRWLDHPNNIRWSVQVMKLLIMQSSPVSCHFLPLRYKYSPQHPVFKHPQSIVLDLGTRFRTHTTQQENSSSLYFNCKFLERRRKKFLNWIVGSIPRI
jgi:hypothetical protein